MVNEPSVFEPLNSTVYVDASITDKLPSTAWSNSLSGRILVRSLIKKNVRCVPTYPKIKAFSLRKEFLYPCFEKVGGILVYICPSFHLSVLS